MMKVFTEKNSIGMVGIFTKETNRIDIRFVHYGKMDGEYYLDWDEIRDIIEDAISKNDNVSDVKFKMIGMTTIKSNFGHEYVSTKELERAIREVYENYIVLNKQVFPECVKYIFDQILRLISGYRPNKKKDYNDYVKKLEKECERLTNENNIMRERLRRAEEFIDKVHDLFEDL